MLDHLMFEDVGRTWTVKDLPSDIAISSYQTGIVTRVVELLSKKPPRSVLISGDRGTGKSIIINLISKELAVRHWTISVASAMDIIAGQMYIGMLDGRIKHFLATLENKKRMLWIAPNFQELFFSGKTVQDPSGILDRFLPHIESGNITVLGEIHANDLEKILRYRPKLKTAMEVIRLEPLALDETIHLAKNWCELPGNTEFWGDINEKDLKEASKFSRQFLGFTKEPGNLFSFLHVTQTIHQSRKEKNGKKKITPNDFIFSLSAITGLPLSILDDQKKLDLDSLREEFFSRVIGQDEAVNTLIERIAMIKAGFTDPSRPLGVFLFVGPTGTGKTEIAKMLANYLFSSEDRMIRLDMSEFKTVDSMERLTGAGIEDAISLVNEIRKNPFSVVLLDEFEKAHPNIWDLFLQLFDDARLTDSNGNTADFRYAIIIMTSNLGASLPTGHKIGFGQERPEFDSNQVTKTLHATFKPEFLNRIDRIVTFNPLSKSTMRQILKNELQKVLERRGFRQRQWAVEWEDSAIEFLLDKGFSAHLGARPMKRAIEQYLLAPLAITIVTHQYPEGDQFLFVKRNGNQLQVDFIDPDTPDTNWKEQKESEIGQHEKAKHLSLKKIALDPQGSLAELEVLKKQISSFKSDTESKEWMKRKEEILHRMAEPGFWESESRKELLSEVEFRDRFEESLSTVASITERLADIQKTYRTFPQELIRQAADRLILMQLSQNAFEQQSPQDALLRVFSEVPPDRKESQGKDFWEKLVDMYIHWAKKRKMSYEIILKEFSDEKQECIIAVEGFAAFQLLEQECGIHIWEKLIKDNKYDRIKVKVGVKPFPIGESITPKFKTAARQLFESPSEQGTRIVRKYRDKPSALVRDDVRKWRTGRIDRVLTGDFDLME